MRLVLAAVWFSLCLRASGPLPVPNTGAYLGIWADPTLGGPEAAIEAREANGPNGIHHAFAMHLHYYGWKVIAGMMNGGVFQPDAGLAGDISHGRVPVISWTCDGSIAGSDHAIASGDASEDAIISATARALAQYPGPVLIDVLTPPDTVDGAVTVLATNHGANSPSFSAQGQALSPSFFVFNGATTAAKPGEFQFNVVVPPNTPDGDQPITATYRGASTQSGALITVHH